MGMQYKASGDTSWTVYYFERNLQGDVIALYNSSGTKLITYTYDAYGNATVLYSSGSASFISPDNIDVITATLMALTDKNLFAYCDNSPAKTTMPVF